MVVQYNRQMNFFSLVSLSWKALKTIGMENEKLVSVVFVCVLMNELMLRYLARTLFQARLLFP